MIDITGNKKVEEELKDSEKKYKNLFYNAQVGIFRSTIDGNKFLDLNDKMAETMGYKRSELIKINPVNLWIYPEQRKKMMDILNNKGSVSDYEILSRDKNDNIIYIDNITKKYTLNPKDARLKNNKRVSYGFYSWYKPFREMFEEKGLEAVEISAKELGL